MNISAEIFESSQWWTEPARNSQPDAFQVGNFRVNPRTREARAEGVVRRLRRKELELLLYLYRGAGTVFTRDELLKNVWDAQNMVTRTVDQTVATLRRKLGENPQSPKFLQTVHGVGYRLRTGAKSTGEQDCSSMRQDQHHCRQ
jgi:DNA-binding response OmpR family regulator